MFLFGFFINFFEYFYIFSKNNIFMADRRIIFKYIAFVILLLLLVPVLGAFFVQGGRLYSFDSVFSISKFYLVWVIALGVLILLIRDKKIRSGKTNYFLLSSGLFLIVSSFYFYSDFDRIQNEGFAIKQNEGIDEPGYVNFDSSQYINIPYLTRQ